MVNKRVHSKLTQGGKDKLQLGLEGSHLASATMSQEANYVRFSGSASKEEEENPIRKSGDKSTSTSAPL